VDSCFSHVLLYSYYKLYRRVKFNIVFADSISYTPCCIEKTLLLPQLINMSM
jgi:hypothetical protein